MRTLALAVAAFALALLTPVAADAAIHSGRITFPEPKNPPSIGVPPPPADQTRESDREVVVRYNASAGSVTFSDEVWDPSQWGEQLSEGFSIGSKCKEGFFLSPTDFHAHVGARPKRIEPGPGGGGTTERGGVTGAATLRGYAGEVESKGTFNGKRFEITFTSSAFRNRDWRCVSVNEPILNPATFHLGGWPKPRRKPQHRG